MTEAAVQIRVERRGGACLLRISGELDLITADSLGERADAAVEQVPGAVLVDLSGLTFIDARAARALDAVIRTLPEGRPVSVRCCPRGIRRAFDLLGLSLDYKQADVPGILHDAREARLAASARLARLTDTGIRLASTVERAGLIREQGRQALAASRAARVIRENHVSDR